MGVKIDRALPKNHKLSGFAAKRRAGDRTRIEEVKRQMRQSFPGDTPVGANSRL